uniref:Uncharacterized protein n=1 Tax=Anguilla anguilla TaxID=7936 RepID=A0A0E9U0D1_ANGAN
MCRVADATCQKEFPVFKLSKSEADRHNQWDPYSWKRKTESKALCGKKKKRKKNS